MIIRIMIIHTITYSYSYVIFFKTNLESSECFILSVMPVCPFSTFHCLLPLISLARMSLEKKLMQALKESHVSTNILWKISSFQKSQD